ncbi:DUF6671 family protein [Legionella hackeliae]|uniref:DUF6671 domain-containing protein n=1 Tax=Legionella hackeliae TaxID=449 RepID=A0A0A8UXM3_LEGHA|nr:DUF6671 family protein [Legionella hackeliae]KTD13193.1 hypothetical protein Lhac_1062 [Legionella hackeliae]CEK11494.1 conserved protein of unknown function [Legionella hackeliae]STX48262.1 Uncharacterised protein [Legionella hackeliae]
MSYYKNQSVLLATMHEKEKAISDIFLKKLGCHVCVENFDTDQFGTFTGETPRPLSPYNTCLLKVKKAMEQYDYELGLGSEGSFGPHPAIPFIPAGHEIMVFFDKKNNWVISEQLISEKTNYNMITIDSKTEIKDFLMNIGFPKHAVTLQTNETKEVIAKGIKDLTVLSHFLEKGFQKEEYLFLATDMRAMMNPTRMNVLRELADKLTIKIASCCPECNTPGFGFSSTQGKLHCKICELPTSIFKEEVWACIQCDYKEVKPRRDGLKFVEAKHCDYCNP